MELNQELETLYVKARYGGAECPKLREDRNCYTQGCDRDCKQGSWKCDESTCKKSDGMMVCFGRNWFTFCVWFLEMCKKNSCYSIIQWQKMRSIKEKRKMLLIVK